MAKETNWQQRPYFLSLFLLDMVRTHFRKILSFRINFHCQIISQRINKEIQQYKKV